MKSLVFLLCLSFVCVRSQNVHEIESLVDSFIYDEEHLCRVLNYRKNDAALDTVLDFYEIYMEVNFGEIGIFQMISKRKLSNDYQTLGLIKHIEAVNSSFAEAYTLIKRRSYADILKFVNEMPRMIKSHHSRFLLRDSTEHYWRTMQNTSRTCDDDTRYILAQAQLFREFYKEILAHLLKSYILLQFTHALLATSPQWVGKISNANEERTSFRSTVNEWKNRIFNYESKYRTEHYSREMWACDPNGFILSDGNDSFVEVAIPYQGFISNEIGLNRNRNCRQSCSDYATTRQYICGENSSCLSGKYSVNKKFLCKGSVEKCVRIPFDMAVCVAPLNSTRRYDFIKYNGGDKVIGVERNCDNEFNLVSYWHWLFKCDNCFCYCNEEDNTFTAGRHFSLLDVTSDIAQNLIVAGVGITKVNHVIQLTILQRQLLPNGVLSKRNETKNQHSDWITSPQLNITGDYHQKSVENEDYVSVTWSNRSIALTSAIIKENDHVLTGVRFRQKYGHIGIEIRATRCDFESGMLTDIENSFWIRTGDDSTQLTELSLDRPDLPIKSPVKSTIFPENNEFIKFQPSDMDKDGAQTIVPYMDTTTVIAYVPLSGVGLYYKSTSGYGGFIAPKLITYDFGRIRKKMIGLQRQRPVLGRDSS